MANKRLAINDNGEMTWCTASPENIGRGRCNHVLHQKDGESPSKFMMRVEYSENWNKAKSFLNENDEEALNGVEKLFKQIEKRKNYLKIISKEISKVQHTKEPSKLQVEYLGVDDNYYLFELSEGQSKIKLISYKN